MTRTSTRRRRPWLRSTALALGSLCLSISAVSAHAVVIPSEASTGAYQKYVLRVPNERGFPTVRVAITFPSGVRVISFDDVPGWTLETVAADAAGSVSAATWTGTIPVGRFVEFAFIGVNPEQPTTLKWDVVQTYDDGTEVSWSGPEDSSTPASVTQVLAPVEAAPAEVRQSPLGTLLGGAALLVALLSLGLSLRTARP
jgi:uncharacterized protein YcnI